MVTMCLAQSLPELILIVFLLSGYSLHLVISVTLLGQTTLEKMDLKLQINVHVVVRKTIEYRPQMNQHNLCYCLSVMYRFDTLVTI